MKRFLFLLALAAYPACNVAAEAVKGGACCSTMDKACECLTRGPVSASDETWHARTDLSATWGRVPPRLKDHDKRRSYGLYSLNTIQPLVRSDDMHNTLLGHVGFGFQSSRGNVMAGLGYRHLVASTDHMFGLGANYSYMNLRHVRYRGPGAYIEWLSKYTTLTLSRFWNRWRVSEDAWKSYLKSNTRGNTTHLDLTFQFPYLPWAQIMIGKTWIGDKVGRRSFQSNYRGASLARLDYGLRLNLLGCLALEGGTLGTGSNNYLRLVVSFGRPAVNEYALCDGCLADGAFSARDLKNYTLAPVLRHSRVDTRTMIN
jgi:hypothetical protein